MDKPLCIICHICLGLGWGPSIIIGSYKCCKYCQSEEYDSAHAQVYSVSTYRTDPYTGKKEFLSNTLHDPGCANACAIFICWSIGGPLSTILVSKKLYNNYTFRRYRDKIINNNVVTAQPQSIRLDNISQKYKKLT
jgi:hypothetical protein